MAGILAAGVYGGYFGAAQGVILVGAMSVLLPLHVQSINGIKNVLGLVVNLVAAVVFLIVEPSVIDWWVVLAVGLGALVGGSLGARIGRALPPWLLRTVIVVIGLVAMAFLLLT